MAVGEGETRRGVTPETGGTEREIDRDDVFDVLSNPRRRYALHVVRGEDQVELGEVAEQVAAWENDTTVELVDSSARKNTYTALQQRHFPRMDEMGVVEFDRRAGVVEPTDALAELDIYLEVVDDRDIPWSEYYLGLGAVSAGIVAAAHVGVPGISAVAGLGWASFVTVGLLVSAAVHYVVTRRNRLGATDAPPEVDGD